MSKVVFVTDHVPGHDTGFQKSGHGHYLKTFVDYFNERQFDVTSLVLRPKVDFIRISAAELPYRLEGPAFRLDGGRIVLRSLKDMLRCILWHGFASAPQNVQNVASSIRLRAREMKGFSHDLGRPISPEERAYVSRAIARIRPDIVMYDGIFNACGRLGDAQHWVISHEVKHERARSFADRGVSVSPAGFDMATECRIIEEVGNVIAIQWDDAAEFKRLAPSAVVVVVPVAIDIEHLSDHRKPVPGRVVFVGSGSFHNYDGIRWFLERCWTTIRSLVPEASLEIVGSVCARLGNLPAGVTLRGVVDDIADAYREASCVVVPLQIGSGLKVKVIEAMAHGVPIVTTSVGAQGLAQFDPQPFVIADDGVAFAASCVDVLGSEQRRRELSAAASECASRFTMKTAFEEFTHAMALEPVA